MDWAPQKTYFERCMTQLLSSWFLLQVVFPFETTAKKQLNMLTLFRTAFLMAAHRREEVKHAISLRSVTHILHKWNLALLDLTKRRHKKYINHVIDSLSSADISIFFSRNQQFLLFWEIQIKRAFKYITCNSFKVLKGFNKHGYNFDQVSKIGWSRLP